MVARRGRSERKKKLVLAIQRDLDLIRSEEGRASYRAFSRRDSLSRRAFTSPDGLHAIADMNQPAAWSAGLAAIGGVGSAQGLAKIGACGAFFQAHVVSFATLL